MRVAGLAIVPVELAALTTGAPSDGPIDQSTVSSFSRLGEPLVLLLLGLILATVSILLARRSSEKRLLFKSRTSRDV
jgi:hypothetical protein